MERLNKLFSNSFFSILFWVFVIFLNWRFVPKLFISNVALIVVLAVLACALFFYDKKKLCFIIIFAGIVSLCAGISMAIFGVNPGAVEELSKVILGVIGGLIIAKALTYSTIVNFLRPFPVVMMVYLILLMVILNAGVFDAHDRLALYFTLGGPNTIAFIIGIGMILLIFYSFLRWAWLRYITLFILSMFLILTFSRSGILGLICGLIFGFVCILFRIKQLNIHFKKVSLVVFLGVLTSYSLIYWQTHQILLASTHDIKKNPIQNLNPVSLQKVHIMKGLHKRGERMSSNLGRFNIYNDYLRTRFSGRALMWVTLLRDWFVHPAAWLTGFGPGWVSRLNIYNVHYLSMDSFIIMSIWSYGVVGFILASVFLWFLLFHKTSTLKERVVKATMGCFLIVTLLTNYSLSATQALVYGAFAIGLVFCEGEQDANNEK